MVGGGWDTRGGPITRAGVRFACGHVGGRDAEQPERAEQDEERRDGIVQGAVGEHGVAEPERDHHYRQVGVQDAPGCRAQRKPVARRLAPVYRRDVTSASKPSTASMGSSFGRSKS